MNYCILALSKKDLIENNNNKNSEEQQKDYGSYLLYVNSTGLYSLPYSTENKKLSVVEIRDSTEDNNYTSFRTFTTDYADKNIYILKPIDGNFFKLFFINIIYCKFIFF